MPRNYIFKMLWYSESNVMYILKFNDLSNKLIHIIAYILDYRFSSPQQYCVWGIVRLYKDLKGYLLLSTWGLWASRKHNCATSIVTRDLIGFSDLIQGSIPIQSPCATIKIVKFHLFVKKSTSWYFKPKFYMFTLLIISSFPSRQYDALLRFMKLKA